MKTGLLFNATLETTDKEFKLADELPVGIRRIVAKFKTCYTLYSSI